MPDLDNISDGDIPDLENFEEQFVGKVPVKDDEDSKKRKRIDEKSDRERSDYERSKSKFKCDICGDTYFTEGALEAHKTLCKLESKPKGNSNHVITLF